MDWPLESNSMDEKPPDKQAGSRFPNNCINCLGMSYFNFDKANISYERIGLWLLGLYSQCPLAIVMTIIQNLECCNKAS
ncbi:unnamed protein product [Larinioides sclopetarius]|uniref:Uncharacterized protein n=1 Tax=Larinioides sclopetarius TaxID=280406 RepID=A0AAV1YSV8_9ARAC